MLPPPSPHTPGPPWQHRNRADMAAPQPPTTLDRVLHSAKHLLVLTDAEIDVVRGRLAGGESSEDVLVKEVSALVDPVALIAGKSPLWLLKQTIESPTENHSIEGVRVQIDLLKNALQHNGREGTLVSYDPSSERFTVRLDDEAGTLKVKTSNVILTETPPPMQPELAARKYDQELAEDASAVDEMNHELCRMMVQGCATCGAARVPHTARELRLSEPNS